MPGLIWSKVNLDLEGKRAEMTEKLTNGSTRSKTIDIREFIRKFTNIRWHEKKELKSASFPKGCFSSSIGKLFAGYAIRSQGYEDYYGVEKTGQKYIFCIKVPLSNSNELKAATVFTYNGTLTAQGGELNKVWEIKSCGKIFKDKREMIAYCYNMSTKNKYENNNKISINDLKSFL